MAQRGSCREIVLVNRTRKIAAGVATDVSYGQPLSAPVDVSDGDYEALRGAELVMITSGVNEKSGGATDRDDSRGRLKLLDDNAKVYREIIPRIVEAAPDATLLVVTDPPDPLTDITRQLAGHERVFSTGTVIDSLRLRVHIGRRLTVAASSVEAMVIGEHGKSSVTLWSSATVAGIPVNELFEHGDSSAAEAREAIEDEVQNANITIIEGIGASQYGIGVVSARLTEAVLRDEGAVFPVGSYHEEFGVSLSLPAIVGRGGVVRTLPAELSYEEHEGLERSTGILRDALAGSWI
jgi:L-lactate dehydrogenase